LIWLSLEPISKLWPSSPDHFPPTTNRLPHIGWHGIAAAKTYLEVNSEANVAVFEEAWTVEGVWARHRLYPGLRTNNLLGTCEYSDFPLDAETYGVQAGRPIPGDVICRYLAEYAENFWHLREDPSGSTQRLRWLRMKLVVDESSPCRLGP
jgi:hypothetical protein